MKIISPNWAVSSKVVAFSTTREGGYSLPPYNSFNLGDHVGDSPLLVKKNRLKLVNDFQLPEEPSFLTQTHSSIVVKNTESFSSCEADAIFADEPHKLCAVLTADCLPILICDEGGSEIAAVHAGWRGLLSGIIENTIEKFKTPRQYIHVFLCPAISQDSYEVGQELFDKFTHYSSEASEAFIQINENKWLMDIYTLAKQRLSHLGIFSISGGEYCTYKEKELFFSFRREELTGRMANLIYLKQKE